MTGHGNAQDRELVTLLQEGLPIAPRPFDRLGEPLGLDGDAVVARVRALFDAGTARRLGGVFDSRSLGYTSTLCAVNVPESELDRAVAQLAPDPGVTHCYLRQGSPNLWFTLTARRDHFAATLAGMAAALTPCRLVDLPAIRRFKIEAVFDMRDAAAGPSPDRARPPRGATAAATALPPLTEEEQAVVRALQGNVPLSRDPFAELAATLNMAHDRLLALLSRWQQCGRLRRVGLIVRHTRLGFRANGMCVWQVEADRVAAAGQHLAAQREVSHCYERRGFEGFPYNLYAMIHAGDNGELKRCFERLSAELGLDEGRMMVSLREFKKSSPVFFCEPPAAGRADATQRR